MSNEKWVERVRYSGFQSEEEAKRWLDEQLKWFSNVEREMSVFHEGMLWLAERFFEPLRLDYRAKPEDLLARVESMEKELGEVKSLLTGKYVQKPQLTSHHP